MKYIITTVMIQQVTNDKKRVYSTKLDEISKDTAKMKEPNKE